MDVRAQRRENVVSSLFTVRHNTMAAQAKRIGESKIIAARAEVESAKLMRQAADILSSAPAMQIRYLEAMQAMAKSSNSKVIFMPAAPGIKDAAALGVTKTALEGGDAELQQIINTRMMESI